MKNTKILKRGNNQTQREPRTIKQRRGTRGSGCCTLDLFKVLCKRNCRTSCHIFKRLRIESNWKRGRKVKLLGGNAIVLLSIIVENDFVPHFIVPQCELFLFTFWSRWRGKYTWHDSRDSFIVYILYYIYIRNEKIEIKFHFENFNFWFPQMSPFNFTSGLEHALFLDTKRKNALDTYGTR